jgi:hypothetical protein
MSVEEKNILNNVDKYLTPYTKPYNNMIIQVQSVPFETRLQCFKNYFAESMVQVSFGVTKYFENDVLALTKYTFLKSQVFPYMYHDLLFY